MRINNKGFKLIRDCLLPKVFDYLTSRLGLILEKPCRRTASLPVDKDEDSRIFCVLQAKMLIRYCYYQPSGGDGKSVIQLKR